MAFYALHAPEWQSPTVWHLSDKDRSLFRDFIFLQPLGYFVLRGFHIPSPDGNTVQQGRFRAKF